MTGIIRSNKNFNAFIFMIFGLIKFFFNSTPIYKYIYLGVVPVPELPGAVVLEVSLLCVPVEVLLLPLCVPDWVLPDPD